VRSFFALVAFALLAAAATYTVRPGDTLGAVARRFHVPIDALIRANHIKDPDRIVAGKQLVIPGATPGAVPARAAAPVVTHVVKKGETLSAIATAQHVSVATLVKANKLANANRLRIGQVLVVPGAARRATWVCPVAGGARFYDDFGEPRGGRPHLGIDMLAPRGTPVVATVNGVLRRHDNARGGHAFYIDGDDGREYYGAHLATFVRGDGRVHIGDTIGTVGNTGNAAGGPTHLHFEVMVGEGNADPYGLLSHACPRR
jgi:murein DD-endopeptidase MepM/ murein hydrolase activator NlpD